MRTYHEPGNVRKVRSLRAVIFIIRGPLRYLIAEAFSVLESPEQ